MRRILFPCIATAALAVAGFDAAAPANAADLYVSPQPRARVQYDYDSAPRYRYQRVDVYEEPAPVYYAPQPWSPGWYQYCGSRYGSFNPQTGYFLGYDGAYHFCQ